MAKTRKWGYAINGPYLLMGLSQHTVVIQREGLAERTTADKVSLVPRWAGVPQVLLGIASAMNDQHKNFEGTH